MPLLLPLLLPCPPLLPLLPTPPPPPPPLSPRPPARRRPRGAARPPRRRQRGAKRPVLPRVSVPCLNVVGRRSAVFPWWGCEEVARLVPDCQTVFFETENHWLYIEQPQKFSQLVAAFATQGFEGVARVWQV